MKRLYKSTTDKKVDGVIGGIAEYFEVDSSILRVAFVLITIFSGIFPGLIAYLIMMVIVPPNPSTVEQE